MNNPESPSNFDERNFPFVPGAAAPQPQSAPLQAAVPPYQPQPVHQPVSPIVHAPAVAVAGFSDVSGFLWTGLVLNLTGLYPLFILLFSLDNPRHMDTVGAWILVSAFLFIGTMLSGSAIKEKGHQNESIRLFAIVSFFVGILFFFIPVIASVLYGLGIGN
jgi:hypothetical protein